MADRLFEYIDWRGDLSFETAPLNEADAFIISKIGSPDYGGIVPENSFSIGISEAVNNYFSQNDPAGKPLGAFASPGILPMLQLLPDTVRFGELRLSAFSRKLASEETKQFSALTVKLPDGRHMITFRGTDDSMTGWKEDLLMSCMDIVPAQSDALDYLRRAAYLFPGRFLISGHSKGGNLALFAAAMAPRWIRDRIDAVYTFDSPGFFPDFYKSEGYLDIRERLRSIVPQSTIVGTFLFQDKEPTIIKCDKGPIGSHDGFNWEVNKSGFVPCCSLSRTAATMDRAVDNVILNMDQEERRQCVEELFRVLTAAGAESITDLTEHKLTNALSIARGVKNSPAVRSFIGLMLGETLRSIKG